MYRWFISFCCCCYRPYPNAFVYVTPVIIPQFCHSRWLIQLCGLLFIAALVYCMRFPPPPPPPRLRWLLLLLITTYCQFHFPAHALPPTFTQLFIPRYYALLFPTIIRLIPSYRGLTPVVWFTTQFPVPLYYDYATFSSCVGWLLQFWFFTRAFFTTFRFLVYSHHTRFVTIPLPVLPRSLLFYFWFLDLLVPTAFYHTFVPYLYLPHTFVRSDWLVDWFVRGYPPYPLLLPPAFTLPVDWFGYTRVTPVALVVAAFFHPFGYSYLVYCRCPLPSFLRSYLALRLLLRLLRLRSCVCRYVGWFIIRWFPFTCLPVRCVTVPQFVVIVVAVLFVVICWFDYITVRYRSSVWLFYHHHVLVPTRLRLRSAFIALVVVVQFTFGCYHVRFFYYHSLRLVRWFPLRWFFYLFTFLLPYAARSVGLLLRSHHRFIFVSFGSLRLI